MPKITHPNLSWIIVPVDLQCKCIFKIVAHGIGHLVKLIRIILFLFHKNANFSFHRNKSEMKCERKNKNKNESNSSTELDKLATDVRFAFQLLTFRHFLPAWRIGKAAFHFVLISMKSQQTTERPQTRQKLYISSRFSQFNFINMLRMHVFVLIKWFWKMNMQQ